MVGMYKLRSETLGVVLKEDGPGVVVMIPANALLEVTREDAEDGTVNVIWNRRCAWLFAIDLRQRGDPVPVGNQPLRIPADVEV